MIEERRKETAAEARTAHTSTHPVNMQQEIQKSPAGNCKKITGAIKFGSFRDNLAWVYCSLLARCFLVSERGI